MEGVRTEPAFSVFLPSLRRCGSDLDRSRQEGLPTPCRTVNCNQVMPLFAALSQRDMHHDRLTHVPTQSRSSQRAPSMSWGRVRRCRDA